MQLEDRGLRELLQDSGFVSAGLAMLRERIAPVAAELARRLRDDGGARQDVTGQDLLVLIRMLASLTPEAAGRPAAAATGVERYLDLVLDGLHPPPEETRKEE
jgi:hypothetical protein